MKNGVFSPKDQMLHFSTNNFQLKLYLVAQSKQTKIYEYVDWSMVIWLKLLCRKQFYFILSSVYLYLPIVISGKCFLYMRIMKKECLLQMLHFPFSGQQIMSKIESFQNADFLISRPDHVVWPLAGIVLERRFQ